MAMNPTKSAIVADLEELERRVSKILQELEHAVWYPYTGNGTLEQQAAWEAANRLERKNLRDGLMDVLRSLSARILIYAGLLGLSEIQRMVQQWDTRWTDEQLRKVEPWSTHEAEGYDSPAFSELQRILEPLLVILKANHEPVAAVSSPSRNEGHGPPSLERGQVLQNVVDLLAEVAHDSESATTLALRAGFPPADLRKFETSAGFWGHVVREANNGRIPLNRVLEEAMKRYPHNEDLRSCAEQLEMLRRS